MRDRGFVAENDRNRDSFPAQTAGGREHPLVVALRQHDLAQMLPCAIKKLSEQIHLSHLVRKRRARHEESMTETTEAIKIHAA